MLLTGGKDSQDILDVYSYNNMVQLFPQGFFAKTKNLLSTGAMYSGGESVLKVPFCCQLVLSRSLDKDEQRILMR